MSAIASGPSLRADPVAVRTVSTEAALRWLVNLRWHAVIGQAITIAFSGLAIDRSLPLHWLLAVVALTAVSNVALMLRRGEAVAVSVMPSPTVGSQRLLTVVIVFDSMVLTALLALSGGARNPFAMLYLAHVALAAFVLDTRSTIAITALVAIAFGALVCATDVPSRAHLYATWMALVLTSSVVAVVVRRLAHAVRVRHDALLRAQRATGRAETIAALGMLAAGAAHELATPLGTIAVTANELDRLILSDPEHAVEDACLIRDEVERCREIIQRMSARAGEQIGELPTTVTLAELRRRVLDGFTPGDVARIAWLATNEEDEVTLPALSLSQALGSLVANALAATRADGSVVIVDVRLDIREIELVVSDRGPGIPVSIRDRLGDPFLTTKPAGHGMGLGIFLCQAFVDAWSGRLEFAHPDEGGTIARVRFPRMAEAR
jgi:two-component system sensor histidine kinase RegB